MPIPTCLCSVLLAAGGEVVPVDGMLITEDTTFVTGTYVLPTGVKIGAPGITLDMNGAVLDGDVYDGFGVNLNGFDDVTIANGTMRHYYYGAIVRNCARPTITNCNLSDNWVDPAALGEDAPFLDIHAPADLGDRVNLGGGLLMVNVSAAAVLGNTAERAANGLDLYEVTLSHVSGNACSDNKGWGIHLSASTFNVISDNTADRCTRAGLGDSAGVLLVDGCSGNQIIGNSFRYSGDGFFIGNEHGCPSNDNLVQYNDGSFAGANAFEATFSSGNLFIGNRADGSRYGFWLGYSHTGNLILGNSIRANEIAGIEIEHGQDNAITGNAIIGNGGAGIVLRTDGVVHFPAKAFPCLDLPAQELSRDYDISDNVITSNFGAGLVLTATTDSLIVNNLVAANAGGTATSDGAANTWTVDPVPGENIVGGPTLGGNYWGDYAGVDTDGDGLGDTELPYDAGGAIAPPGDPHPLIGDPDIETFDNPLSLCARTWTDWGRNTRTDDSTFDTANGAHFTTDGTDVYLIEGTNGPRFDRLDRASQRYEPRADLPEAVWDGGGLQWAGDVYLASPGIQFDPATGDGKGPKLYAYDPGADAWSTRAPATVDGAAIAIEDLTWDPDGARVYASIVAVADGGLGTARRRLAIYDPATDAWTGYTQKSAFDFSAGSEIACVDGRVYAWPGGFGGGSVTGADSYLHVYDIAGDTWSTTSSLQDSGVIPGFRSGAFDVWGVALAVDPEHGRVFVLGGEANREVYVYDVATDTWTATPRAPYDGGWGDALVYAWSARELIELDGRAAGGTPQGTAVLGPPDADVDGDGFVGVSDLLEILSRWGVCDSCCAADVDEDGSVGVGDLLAVLGAWR